MGQTRRRLTTLDLMAGIVLIALLLFGARSYWDHVYGGAVSREQLGALQLGMTRQQVEAVVGPPSHGSPSDAHWVITRDGSFWWLELSFDEDGRLEGFREDAF